MANVLMPIHLTPQELSEHKYLFLIRHPNNPNNCHCGWYTFIKSCDCYHVKADEKCGARISPTGKPAFCRTPAPTHEVLNVRIKAECVRHPPQLFQGLSPADFNLFRPPTPRAASNLRSRQFSILSMTPVTDRASRQSARVKTESTATSHKNHLEQDLRGSSQVSSTSSSSTPSSRSRRPTPKPHRQQQHTTSSSRPSSQDSARKSMVASQPGSGSHHAAPGAGTGFVE